MGATLGENDRVDHNFFHLCRHLAWRFGGKSSRAGMVSLALVASLVIAACGGGGSDDRDEAADSNSASSGSPSSTRDSEKPGGVAAPLKPGSSAEIDAPDVGKVTMDILEILSPADQILGAGLTVDSGSQLWAVKAKVNVSGGAETAVAEFVVTTDDGNLYGFTGTASTNDLGYAFGQGTTSEGFIAFQLPAEEEIVSLRASFSNYAGYDIVFES